MREPVVILPGLLCDSRMFRAQIEALSAQVVEGFYGGADRIGAMAEHALAQMPERCALLGHSMGARVALEIWRRAPERIARLALADTGVHPVGEGEAERRFALRDIGRRDGDEALVDAWLPPMVGISHRQDEDLMAGLRAMAVAAGTATFERQIMALLHRPEAAGLLATISCPTVVIVGAEDEWSPVAQHQRIAAAIPGARLRVLAKAGHMAPAEDPHGFNEILRDWLSWPA
jgi:pimeloyl-ACP methyl ester carboxylesterase